MIWRIGTNFVSLNRGPPTRKVKRVTCYHFVTRPIFASGPQFKKYDLKG